MLQHILNNQKTQPTPPTKTVSTSAATRVSVFAQVIPCLFFHVGEEIPLGVPNIHSCGVNMRNLEICRLGVQCKDKNTNLVHQLRCGDIAAKVALGGIIVVVMTSFEKINTNNDSESFVMRSISQHKDKSTIYHATPLTIEILMKAMKWLKGDEAAWQAYLAAQERNGEEEEEEDQEEAMKFDSLEEGFLTIFLTMLNKMIPLQQTTTETRQASDIMEDAYVFLQNHTWGEATEEANALMIDIRYGLEKDDPLEDSMCRFDADADHYQQMCYKARHFINCNVALQTGVVASIVDGLHRMSALECCLNGFRLGKEDEEESSSITTYHNTLPHSQMKINITIILLTDSHVKREEAFITEMKNLSLVTQNNCGCLQKLDKKVFFTKMIRLLDKRCEQKYIIDLLTKKNNTLDSIMEGIMDQITTLLCSEDAKTFMDLVPRMLEGMNKSKTKDWKKVFKSSSKSSSGVLYDECFLCNTIRVTAIPIIHKWGFLYHENRYSHITTINAELFELLLILIWSRLSIETYRTLDVFFGYDSTLPQISTSSDQLVNEWLTSMIINVFSFVYYSSSFMFVDKRKRKIKITREAKTSVYTCQLVRAITSCCTAYFSKLGPNPVLPSWFEDVQKQKVANELYVLEQYQHLVTQAGISKRVESVARKKDHIVSLIVPGSWRNYVNYYSYVTVAYSRYLSHLTKPALSLGKYLESEDTIKEDECWTFITRTFLKYYVPRKDESILLTIPHTIPTESQYELIEDVITNLKTLEVGQELRRKSRTAATHLEKFQIERLLTLINSVDTQLFNSVYVSKMNRSNEKK